MRTHLIALTIAAATSLLLITPTGANTLRGKAIHITDGDTLIVLDDQQKKHKVRLAAIDCPEKKQPWGSKAKKALASMVGNRQVVVAWRKLGRYGRIIGDVYLADAPRKTLPYSANYRLVAEGHCWSYRQYRRRPIEQAEKQAREQGKGLWSLPEAQRTPPWEWRKGGRR